MLQKTIDTTVTTTGITGATTTTAVPLGDYSTLTFSSQAVITVTTPSAQLFASTAVDTTLDVITKASHGFFTGLKGQFTTTGVLPTGISAATDYFLIVLTANTFKVATSYANAIAGTAIDITAQGSGNDTFTPTAIAGATITPQISNNNSTWDDYTTATSITVSTSVWFTVSAPPPWKWFRWKFAITAGSLTCADNQLIRAYTT